MKMFRLSTLVFSLGLAACGGGGGDTASTPPPDPLATTSAVAARLIVGPVAALLPDPVATAKLRAEGLPPPGAVHVKAVQACPGGGTQDVSALYQRDMDSPFSAEIFLAEDRVVVQCRHDNPSGYSIVDGLAVGGCPQSHLADGDNCPPRLDRILSVFLGSAQSPYRFTARIASSDGPVDHQDVISGGVIHERNNGQQIQASELSVPFTRTRSVNGGPAASYSARYGTPSVPLQQSTQAIGNNTTDSSINGALAFDAAGCRLGEFEVSTVVPIRREYSTGRARAVSGTLEIDQTGRTARVVFNADQTLTLTDSSGRSQTYTVQQALDAAGACADFMF